MAKKIDKEKAIKLRLKGQSYSQIKNKINVSKSSLSGWLANYPLSSERIKELRDRNPRRIESYINTMNKKRDAKFMAALDKSSRDIGSITDRDLFMAGFFLYWAEGGKTYSSSVCLSNTDPAMLKVFIKWLNLLGVSKDKLRIKLHLYKDMNVQKEIIFWSEQLGVEKTQFTRSYIKDSRLSGLTYKNGFGHGTCNIYVGDAALMRYILMGMRYIVSVLTGIEPEMRP